MSLINRYPSRSKAQNAGLVGVARSAIDGLSLAHQQRGINALAVQGVPCEYYSMMRSGIVCTCVPKSTPVTPGAVGEVTALDANGNASPERLQAMLQGSIISIDRYGSRKRGFGYPDEYVEERSVPNTPLVQSTSTANKISDYGDPFAEVIAPDDDLDSLMDKHGDMMGEAFDAGASSSGCPICLGTGYVGGYRWVNGLRHVYDTQYPWALTNIVPDNVSLPRGFKGVGNWEARLFVYIPKHASSLRTLRVWNGQEVQSVVVELATDATGSSWVPASVVNFMALADGQLHLFRIRGNTEGFTHLELAFNLHLNPLYVEWSRMVESENVRLPENVDSVSIVIPPSVPNVRMYDLLIDSKYNRVWKITTRTDFLDRQKRSQGWDAQIRLIQDFEFPNLLSVNPILSKHLEFSNAVAPALHKEPWVK